VGGWAMENMHGLYWIGNVLILIIFLSYMCTNQVVMCTEHILFRSIFQYIFEFSGGYMVIYRYQKSYYEGIYQGVCLYI
jgi:hypothetical protein